MVHLFHCSYSHKREGPYGPVVSLQLLTKKRRPDWSTCFIAVTHIKEKAQMVHLFHCSYSHKREGPDGPLVSYSVAFSYSYFVKAG